jgi:hypothetical protein
MYPEKKGEGMTRSNDLDYCITEDENGDSMIVDFPLEEEREDD